MATVALLGAVALASVFVISGIAKLIDRDGTRQAVAGFGVRAELVGAVATLLGPVELVVALALVIPATTVLGLVGSLLLLAGFTGANVAAMRAGRRPECHCFGRIGGGDISGRTVLRNAVLATLAVIGLALRDGSATDLGAGQGATAIVGGVTLAAAVVTVEGFAGRAARLGRDRAQQLAFEQGMAEGDAQRAVAPDFTLPTLAGHDVSREDLLAPGGRPAMLVFLSPGCGPCKTLRPSVIRWFQAYDDRLRIAVVAYGNALANRHDYAGAAGLTVLLDVHGAVRDAFGVRGTPAAVLVGGDGRLMGPIASGELLVRRLLSAGLRGADFEPHDHVDVSGSPAASITTDSVLRPRETVSSVPREQDVILVDETTGASVSLDGIGSVVWSVLDGSSPLGEIIDDLADVFETPREVVGHDTLELARSLGRAGMLEGIAPEPPSEEVESAEPERPRRARVAPG